MAKLKSRKIKPTTAIKYNNNSDEAAFLIPYGGTPDDPEYLYPEELEPAVVTASLSDSRKKQAEKEAATFRSRSLVGHIGGGRDLNMGDQSLLQIASKAIGVPLVLANPVTATIVPEVGGQYIKTYLNPANAQTTTGALLSTGVNSYITAKGLERNSQLINNWLSGEFSYSDIPEFGLNFMGAIPVVNTAIKASKVPIKTTTPQKTLSLAEQEAKALGYGDNINSAKNSSGIDNGDLIIVNQQMTGKLHSHNPSKLTEAERAGVPKGTRNQPLKPLYENLRFIRNLRGLPDMEDGKVLASPKMQYFANFTTDVPFRTHSNYVHRPGGEIMIVHPDAFKGIKPFTIDPMDTIFLNSDLRIDPKHVTIVSGNPTLLRQAKLKGMNVATTPEIRRTYKIIEDQYQAGKIKAFNENYGKKIKFAKDPKWGEGVSFQQEADFTKAVDDYLTSIGRPKYQAYHDMSKAAGLSSHTLPITAMRSQFNSGKAGVNWGNMSKSAFTYPDGQGIIGTKILTYELPSFYKHVGYNPTPYTEADLLNYMGGFSKLHPTIYDVGSYSDDFIKWRSTHVPGTLRNGGKLNNTK